MWPIIGGRKTWLIHELRRQEGDRTVKAYYEENKEKGKPHCSDEVGADITEYQVTRTTRASKKRKYIASRIPPKTYDDKN